MFWAHALMSVLVGFGVTGVHGHAYLNLPWLEFGLATPVVLWCGLPFFQRFWTSLVNRSPNMFTLIGLGTGVAYVYSVVATIAPRVFPESLRGMDGYPDVYFEAASSDHHTGPARPGDGTARPQPHQRCHSRAARPEPEDGAPIAADGPTASRRKTFRSSRSSPATACAFVPAKKFPWTASSSKATAQSTSR